MRWQRSARIVVAVVGVSCAAAVYFLSTKRPPATAPVTSQMTDPTATTESSGGTVHRMDFKIGKEIYSLEYAHSTSYADGRTKFDKIHLVTMRDGKPLEIWADTADEHGTAVTPDNPAVVDLTGNVRILSDGMTVTTDRATYVDATGLLTMPGTVTFTQDRLSGEGGHATFNRDQDLLWLLDGAHIVATPDEKGAGALDGTAKAIGLARASRYARLEDHAVIVHDKETLAADVITLHFTPSEHGLELVEMRGHSSVVPKPGAQNAPPEMRANDINMTFHPDGRTVQRSTLTGRASAILASETGSRSVSGAWIEVTTAPDGKALSGLDARERVVVTLPEAKDVPARTITAATLRSMGDSAGGGLKSALFEGGGGLVEFVETPKAAPGQPATKRVGKSRSLVLALNGDLEAIDQAIFRQDVTFTDRDVSANGDRATYGAKAGTLLLEPAERAPRKPPHVENGTVSVDAQAITLWTITQNLDASGEVKTTMQPAAEGKPKTTATRAMLFDDSQQVLGNSAEFHYLSESQTATFIGVKGAPALVYQDQNQVKAQKVVLGVQTNDLTASGDVQSVFTMARGFGTSAETKPGEAVKNTASGALMVYKDADRLATYTGDATTPALLTGPDGQVTAQRIDLLLAQQQRSFERVEADTDVHATLQGRREARGDRLTYDAAKDEYVLIGRPGGRTFAQVVAPDSPTSTTCKISTAVRLTFKGAGGGAPSVDGGSAGASQHEWPCGKPIPKSK